MQAARDSLESSTVAISDTVASMRWIGDRGDRYYRLAQHDAAREQPTPGAVNVVPGAGLMEYGGSMPGHGECRESLHVDRDHHAEHGGICRAFRM